MNRYLKFIAQLVVAGLLVLVAALVDDRVDTAEWINVALAVLGAVGVLGAGNFPDGVWRHMKLYVSAATAGLIALSSFLVDGGLSTAEILQIVIAVLGALGVAGLKGPLVQPVTDPAVNARRGVII